MKKICWIAFVFFLAAEVRAEPCCQSGPLTDTDLDGIVEKIDRTN